MEKEQAKKTGGVQLLLTVRKKTYEMNGRKGTYYSFNVDFEGETFKFKADDKEKKLLYHFLDKMDIPLEEEDKKAELMERLLSGEYLSDAEKAVLNSLLEDKKGGDE